MSQLSPNTAGGAANIMIVITKNTNKKKITDTRYADSKQGASLLFRFALIEPNSPHRPSIINKMERI